MEQMKYFEEVTEKVEQKKVICKKCGTDKGIISFMSKTQPEKAVIFCEICGFYELIELPKPEQKGNKND